MVSAEAGPAGGTPFLGELDPFSSRQADRLPPDIGPSETALLVIDMVHDYLDPAGAMPLPDTAAVLAAACRLADAAHGSNVLLVWVRPGHFEHADGLFRKRICTRWRAPPARSFTPAFRCCRPTGCCTNGGTPRSSPPTWIFTCANTVSAGLSSPGSR